MKILISLAGVLFLALLPAAASASCFYVFSAQNQLVYRSTISPVDLSRPISDGMKGRYAGGHLTMVPDETGCPDLIAGSQNQAVGIFGLADNNDRSISALDARNMKSATPEGSNVDAPAVAPASGRSSRRRGGSGNR
jgi:hypothetical protein